MIRRLAILACVLWALPVSAQVTPHQGHSVVYLADGSVTVPSLTFTNDPDTGLFRRAANGLVLVEGGVRLLHTAADATADGGNTFLGTYAGNFTLSPAGGASLLASRNTGVGNNALRNLTTGHDNSIVGEDAGVTTDTGYFNTGMGVDALHYNAGGHDNVAIGVGALEYQVNANYNVAVGVNALGAAVVANDYNVAVGHGALKYLTDGTLNVAMGENVGWNSSGNPAAQRIVSDTNMVLLGYGATKDNASTLDNGIAIGAGAHVLASNQAVYGNASITQHVFQSGAVGLKFPGNAASQNKLVKSVTAFTDATPKDILTVTVPNAAHAAVVKLTILGSLGASGAVGAFECSATLDGSVVVARTAGLATVATAATAGLTASSCVAGATTIALAYGVTGMTGNNDATQTFTVQATITKGGGGSAAHTAVILAEVVNSQATGVTIQ